MRALNDGFRTVVIRLWCGAKSRDENRFAWFRVQLSTSSRARLRTRRDDAHTESADPRPMTPLLSRRPALRALRSRPSSLRAGFTLIEILVVIVVIAILATLVAPNIFQHVGAAKSATAKSQIEMLGAALDAYRLDNTQYPTTEQGLAALWEKPTVDPPSNWRSPYLRKPVPLDPWGRPYVYLSPGQVNPQGYDLQTYGADGKPGGEGEDADITSWK
jgi:general secretion pathway protein G